MKPFGSSHNSFILYNLNLATLLPSITNKVFHDCLMLTDHLLTPHDDRQEIHLGNTDFSWFTDGSYLKFDNGKYCAGHAIATLFDVIGAAPLPMAISPQRASLNALTWAHTLAKGKPDNIYTDSRYAFRVAYDLGMLQKQNGFLTSRQNKLKISPMFRNYWI